MWHNMAGNYKGVCVLGRVGGGGWGWCLKMLNLTNFMIALKCSWIRRLLTSNSKWVNMFTLATGISTNELIIFGE